MDVTWQMFSTWSVSQLLVAAALCVATAWYGFASVKSYQRLSGIPGPCSARLSSWWMIRATASGEMHLRLARVCRKYGSLVRIGPNDLVTDDAETLRRINGLRSPFQRSEWYNATAFSHDFNHAFCERNDDLHARRRTILIPGYSGRESDKLESDMDDRIGDFCSLIERKYLSDDTAFRPVDLARICSYFTLEVIHTLAFGGTMGFLEHDKDMHGYLQNQRSMLPLFEWFSTLPVLERMVRLRPISKSLMPRTTDKTGIGLLQRFAGDAVRKRRAREYNDMLASFLRHGLSDREAEQEAILQVIAGADTTATTLRMSLFFIMTNPRVYWRLVTEIQQVGQESGLSEPVSDAEAQGMPFLMACIKESLRMWPPVVGLMSKETPPGGANIMGKFVPEGVGVGYCAWSLFRKQKVFGPDAEVFRPERWLESDTNSNTISEMESTLDLVFGYGKNACLGKPIAYMELRKSVAELIRRFDLSVVDPQTPFNSVNRNGLFLQEGMFVRFSRRG